jgi:hypothetical protein
MRHILRIILILGLGALTAVTLVSCGDSSGGSSSSGGQNGPAITSIDITPENPSIFLYGTQQFTATGTFDDGTTMDVTDEVYWSSTSDSVAIGNNLAGSEGLATSKSAGTTTITAMDFETGISNTTGLNSGCTASVKNSGPVESRSDATVTLALSCSGITSYACTTGSARLCVSGPEDFETGTGGLSVSNAALASCGASGVSATGCATAGGTYDVLELGQTASMTATAIAADIDTTVYTDLQVHLRAAYPAAATFSAGENVTVAACCGPGCNVAPIIGTAPSGDNGGTDEWTERGPFVPDKTTFDNCSATTVIMSLFTDAAGEVAHIDDYALSGVGTLGVTLTGIGGGVYEGGFTTCAPDTVPVTCTWGTAHGTFEADNTTNVTFY